MAEGRLRGREHYGPGDGSVSAPLSPGPAFCQGIPGFGASPAHEEDTRPPRLERPVALSSALFQYSCPTACISSLTFPESAGLRKAPTSFV